MSKIPPKQPMKGTPSPDLGQAGFPRDEESVFAQPSAASPRDDAFAEPGALVSIHQAALHANAESFPVLKSFQDYLEAERARARHRMAMMAGVFVALMLIVVAGFIGGGIFLFSYMARQQNALIEIALNRAQVQPAAPTPIAVAPSQAAPAQSPAAAPTPAPAPAAVPAPVVAAPTPEIAPAVAAPTPTPAPASVAAVPAPVVAPPAPIATTPAPVTAPEEPAAPAPAPVSASAEPAKPAPEIADSDIAAPSQAVAPTQAPSQAQAPVADKPAKRAPIDESKVVAKAEPPPEGFASETVYIPSPAFGNERIPWKYLLPTK